METFVKLSFIDSITKKKFSNHLSFKSAIKFAGSGGRFPEKFAPEKSNPGFCRKEKEWLRKQIPQKINLEFVKIK